MTKSKASEFTGPMPQPGIMDIKLYESGAAKVEGVDNIVKLSSNENPMGYSDAAREAYARAGHELHRYPSTDHASLRFAIGEVHGLDPERIICGVGSDEIITFICQAYAGPGDEVIYTEHGFSMYKISTLAAGATPVMVPEHDRTVNVDEILKGVTENTKIVFIANPANPTGTMVGQMELGRLARELPKHVVLVLDGAYAEYVEGFDGGASMVERFPNVIMTRTFSKIYGLGGLRIGWGYAQKEVIDVLNRLRGPFNLSNTQLGVAEAAVRDQAWVEKCRNENARLRAMLAEGLAEHGVPSDTSCANFVLARFHDEAEAERVDEHLKANGIIVRKVGGYGLPNCLRMTVGDEPSVRRIAHLVGEIKRNLNDG